MHSTSTTSDHPSAPIIIIGAGGFAREVLNYALDCGWKVECFADVRDGPPLLGVPVKALHNREFAGRDVLVSIGSPEARRRVVSELPPSTRFPRLVHPAAYIGRGVELGEGSIVCPHATLTTMIKVGKHAQFNPQTTIGHDCVIGDYCTTAMGVHISGKIHTGDRIFFGAGSVVLQNLTVCSDVMIGGAACVVKSIQNPGTYAGVPAKLLPPKIAPR